MKFVRTSLPALILLLVVVGSWQILVRVNDVSTLVLPAPSDIALEVRNNFDNYLRDAWVTAKEAALGFTLALVTSLAVALAMVHFRVVRNAVDPFTVLLRCLPVVAIAPAMALWLGFGMTPKVLVAALITFPPFLVNLVTGLGRVDAAMLEVLRSVNASRWEIAHKLRIPHALPYAFSAARVGTTLALMGAVVGEWSASSEGLGYRIIRAQKDLATTTVWGAIVVLGAMGIVSTLTVTLIERRALRWQRTN